VRLDPVEGHEQAGRRPALVLSVDAFNAGPADLVTVLPMTTRDRALASRIEVRPPEGGVSKISYVIGEQTRTLSSRRLVKRLGQVSSSTMARASDVVRILLGL
jgi:mRNA interferase MazF